ncbi:phosphoserine phosphatase SerB [Sphingopyxis terrae]|uniref:Phosphoserine phosphatase n=1 Tax=Sphingopyxis terrae subsp. ummariensis TaxID=429001 RepID=A0A1Y6EG62_9SPHN|nr:phosphoserine phosphatase SerB [Sphingopyxis terrae]PCF93195.1 phosphoserine phosphatase SerB [Sphingopyxis terrae subsp. ummariensis]SMQ61369.1 phosphoserine phosphatase [Sphingopyxis terrae subsp. ummariensis]HRE36489.1 phosphoserine phosphatase SerB [Sphingopyxis terrae]
MFVATLIAAGKLTGEVVREAIDRLDATGHEVGAPHWIDQGDAADIFFQGSLVSARAELAKMDHGALDVVVQPLGDRTKKLIIADMDSTMITVECIDELADYAGIKPQIAAITERAMRGELDFRAALIERVGLLGGMAEATIAECRAERVRLTRGARTLVQTMKAHGAWSVLVSGGFLPFAAPVAEAIGFDKVVANELEIAGGKLTGKVTEPIVDSSAKLETLRAEAAARGLALADTLAVGDGANDIPMITSAGLGIGYHPHPAAAAAADAAIRHHDLTALLWAQGYARRQWVMG